MYVLVFFSREYFCHSTQSSRNRKICMRNSGGLCKLHSLAMTIRKGGRSLADLVPNSELESFQILQLRLSGWLSM